MVPLFGLAPGGVWPLTCRQSSRTLLPPDFTLTGTLPLLQERLALR